ncbi:MAG TPA: hypothetical protein VGP08_03750 [Pyrinomonadaceae bacterium]|jgi:hypothetical protein|nr:hypothetical protein [Pyrinomonadaceae bacterium]
MTTEKDSIVFDFRLLFEASKKLHGYLLHTCLKHYLDLIFLNMRRLIEYGALGPDGHPSEETDYRLLVDIEAFDAEKLTYVLGFYLHIFSSHKKANYVLTQKDETKRVLYLRGFDYEGSVSAGGGLAMGYSSVDTTRFTYMLAERLRPDFEIFTALSPRDLFMETAGTEKYFYGDYDGLIRACSEPVRSIYLNAKHWKADVSGLIDRMDYFVVYVSSITESVLWELGLLKKKKRAGDATVVFDEKAIANKEVQFGMQERMKETGDKVLWSKSRPKAPPPTAPELRESLMRDFLVVSPKQFFRGIKRHKTRIGKAQSPLGVGSREEPLPFRFFPAQGASTLKRLRDFDESVDASIRKQISSQSITNLPWFTNNVQLKILTSLMLGRHDETGRALAVYAAVMDVARKQLFGADARADDDADDPESRAHRRLEENFALAYYASPKLLMRGEGHEFGGHSKKALAVYGEVFASASEAVERFFEEGLRRMRA